MLMANNGCSRHHCSQWYLISSLSFSSLPLKANQQHMPYMRMVTCDHICPHIKCITIWIAWLTALCTRGRWHTLDSSKSWRGQRCTYARKKLIPGASWPKVHLLCQVATGWWLQQNQSLKGMFYNELFFNCEKSPKPWALSSPFDVGVYYEFAKIDIWHQCNSASSGKAIKDRVKKKLRLKSDSSRKAQQHDSLQTPPGMHELR